METITMLPLEQLHESPFNPRKIFDEVLLNELSRDIAHQGVLSPLLVRPRVGPLFAGDPDAAAGHEVVFGHRRLRGAFLAGLTEVPCMVRSMSDDEARRAQISENLQRKDVHPIEEAEGFQALIDNDNQTADTIAEQFGKSRSYVYGRLKLLEACPEIRRACLAGEIGSEIALLVARLRTGKLQEKALEYIRNNYSSSFKDGGKKSYRTIRDLLNEKFTLDLKSAFFDIEDEILVPLAGNCVTCPKRSGNAPEFEDVAEATNTGGVKRYVDPTHFGYQTHVGANVCTDPDCFDAKKKAHLKREAGKLEEAGKTVVQGAKARATIDAQGNIKNGFVKLADVRDALKKVGKDAKPAIVTIQDPRTGKTHQAVKLEDAKAAGVKVKEPKPARQAYDWKAEQAKRDAEHAKREAAAKAESAVRLQLLAKVREAALAAPRGTFDLQLIAHVAFSGVDYQDRLTLAELYGEKNRDALHKRIGSMGAADVAMFALDCALVQNVRTLEATTTAFPLEAACKHYSIDAAEIRRSLTEPASTPPSAARAPKGAAKKSSAKKATPAVDVASVAKPKAKTKGKALGADQKDNAGVAGGSDAQAELLADAEA